MISKISDRIRYLRDKNGMTQTYLAKRLGISRSAVNSWEMELSAPSLANIVEMTKIFHVDADYLLSNDSALKIDISDLSSASQEIILKLVSHLSETEKGH